MRSTTYDAFISYAHRDARTAERLQAALRNFARPWYRRRSLRVFRDTSDLAAAPSLWEAVASALDRSRHLIVLASRAAAQSTWVDREVRHWLSSHPPESLCLVRIDGTIRWNSDGNDFDWGASDALPPALKGVYASEPVYIDLGGSPSLSLRDAMFRRAVAQIAAGIKNVELDEILGEDLRRHRQMQLVTAATALVVVTLAGLGGFAFRRSIAEQQAKEREALVALSRRLAAQSREALAKRDDRLALLLGLAGLRLTDTREAYGALLLALTATRHLVADIEVSDVPVNAIALAPDGKTLITGDARGTVAFSRLSGGRRRTYPGVHIDGVTDIAISPDGRLAASGAFNGGFVLWDLASLDSVYAVRDAPGFSLAFTADGAWLLGGGDNGQVSAWDIRRRRTVLARAHPEDGTIVDIAVDSTDDRFATGGLFGQVRIWDRPTFQSVRTIDPTPSTGTSIDISPDGRFLVLAGARAVQMWDLTNQEPYGEPYLSAGPSVNAARLTGGLLDPVIVSVGADLHLWSTELLRVGFHPAEIHSLAIDRDRRLLVTGCADGRARVWSLEPRNPFVATFVVPDAGLAVHAVAFSGDGARVAVGAADARPQSGGARTSTRGIIYIVNSRTGETLGPPLNGHRGAILDLAFSPDGRLASASDDGTVRLWDLEALTSVIVDRGPASGGVRDVAISSDGRLLAFAGADEGAQVWDLSRNVPVWRSEVGNVLAVAFAPHGRELALGTADGEVRVWSINGGTQRILLPRSTEDQSIGTLAFDPDGRRIIALVGGEAKIIDPARGSVTPLSTSGVGPGVRSLSTGPTFVALLEANHRLSLWDLETHEQIVELNRGFEAGFSSWQNRVTVSNDGSQIAMTLGKEVMIFHVGKSAVETRACSIAGGPLSRAEWARLAPETEFMALCSQRTPRRSGS